VILVSGATGSSGSAVTGEFGSAQHRTGRSPETSRRPSSLRHCRPSTVPQATWRGDAHNEGETVMVNVRRLAAVDLRPRPEDHRS
jgi:hypothetical protein